MREVKVNNYLSPVEFSELNGKILKSAERVSLVARYEDADDCIMFETTDGKKYYMFHSQDCCENVRIEDICGDLDSILGEKLTFSEESNEKQDKYGDVEEWTFYHLRTVNDTVTIRWYGTSNGYYGTSAELYMEDKKQ